MVSVIYCLCVTDVETEAQMNLAKCGSELLGGFHSADRATPG